MADRKDPDEFLIYDDDCEIIIQCCNPKHKDNYWDDDNLCWIDESDGNLIEISYRQIEPAGWGVGAYEYVSTSDIKAMADCIRGVIYRKQASAEYTCQDNLFRIHISYDAAGDTYDFTASMLETLIRDHHITVSKDGLTRAALEEYISPFFIWEKKYPIIEGDGIIYSKTPDESRLNLPRPICREPVFRTHHMQTGVGDEELWENLDYSQDHEIIYHAKPGYWLVLETEHYYISIGTDGVNKYKTLEELKGEDRQVWNDPVTGVEEIVFVGEHFRNTIEWNHGCEIVFDHFHLKVVPHENDDGFDGVAYHVEEPFLGFDHVLDKCPCGAKPDFKMDRHGDFYVECPACKRYTDSSYDPADPVWKWNGGEVNCVPGNENQ